MVVQDGPFPETKEQLDGIFVIDVPDVEWAARYIDALAYRHYTRERAMK
jgi:hypothetical protein